MIFLHQKLLTCLATSATHAVQFNKYIINILISCQPLSIVRSLRLLAFTSISWIKPLTHQQASQLCSCQLCSEMLGLDFCLYFNLLKFVTYCFFFNPASKKLAYSFITFCYEVDRITVKALGQVLQGTPCDNCRNLFCAKTHASILPPESLSY